MEDLRETIEVEEKWYGKDNDILNLLQGLTYKEAKCALEEALKALDASAKVCVTYHPKTSSEDSHTVLQ